MDLPDWGVGRILAKIDTGARTSSIHVENLEDLGNGRVRFEVVVARATAKRPERTVTVETELIRTAKVRPSTGRLQRRPVVATHIRIGPVERTVELSLVSRQHMLCRMLLGRAALDGAVLVSPGERYLLTERRLKRRRSSTQ